MGAGVDDVWEWDLGNWCNQNDFVSDYEIPSWKIITAVLLQTILKQQLDESSSNLL